mgnify:CR=1 FL=1
MYGIWYILLAVLRHVLRMRNAQMSGTNAGKTSQAFQNKIFKIDI